MEKEKIYVVTKGSYSCYHIVAATTDKKLAENIAKKFSVGWEEAQIEIYENSKVMLRPLWSVDFNVKGEIAYIRECDDEYDYNGPIGVCTERKDGSIYIRVLADRDESAIKIAAEKRAEYLAQKNGL